MRIGFYSGSFDPVTLGHIYVIGQAARLVDRLVIGVGAHPAKAPLFSEADRIAMLAEETKRVSGATGAVIDVVPFDGLAVDAAKEHGASVIFRGLRDGTDFDYEMQMAGMNSRLEPAIPTVFIPASLYLRHVTSTLVRQIASMGGNVSAFVPEAVVRRIRETVRR